MTDTNRIGHRIGLGTVQFGVDYGVTNTSGMTPKNDVRAILDRAASHGIDLLDTAHLYGQSEAVLGEVISPNQNFRIVTKTPDFSRLELRQQGDAARALLEAFQGSLDKLRVSSVYGLMVHNAGGMNGPYAQEVYQTLQKLKQEGKVQKIGLSVYGADDIRNVTENCGPIDLVQVPLNLFDQRLIKDGTLNTLKTHGVEIHARSLFLQGALLADKVPPTLEEFSGVFSKYHAFLDHHNLSALEACLHFALSITEIDRWIIGVNALSQLQDIIDIGEQIGVDTPDFSALSSNNEILVNPARWRWAK